MNKPHYTATCGKRPKVPEGATHFENWHRNGSVFEYEIGELYLFVWEMRGEEYNDIIAVRWLRADGSEIGR